MIGKVFLLGFHFKNVDDIPDRGQRPSAAVIEIFVEPSFKQSLRLRIAPNYRPFWHESAGSETRAWQSVDFKDRLQRKTMPKGQYQLRCLLIAKPAHACPNTRASVGLPIKHRPSLIKWFDFVGKHSQRRISLRSAKTCCRKRKSRFGAIELGICTKRYLFAVDIWLNLLLVRMWRKSWALLIKNYHNSWTSTNRPIKIINLVYSAYIVDAFPFIFCVVCVNYRIRSWRVVSRGKAWSVAGSVFELGVQRVSDSQTGKTIN